MYLEWMEDGICKQVGVDVMYPERNKERRVSKKVCLPCPVRASCLAEALKRDESGVWGGTSQRQRRLIQAAAGPRSNWREIADEFLKSA